MTAPTISNENNTALTISVQATLATITTAGYYRFYMDLNPIVGGTTPDILELTIQKKIRSTGTTRDIDTASFVGGLIVDPDVYSAWYEVGTSEELVIKLLQTQGTGRTITWAVYQV